MGVFLLTAIAWAESPKKKGGRGGPKTPPVSSPARSELKPSPVMEPVAVEPAPSTTQPRTLPAPASSTLPLTAPRPAVVETAEQEELTPLPRLRGAQGLSVQATGGVLGPLTGLGPGGRAALRATWWLGKVPLAASLAVAFEQHTSRSATTFAPPAGGLDASTLDNQTLLPFEVGVQAALFRDEKNRVHLGVSYSLLAVWSQTIALGDSVLERGVGHEVAGEAGYTRRLGVLELAIAVRYSVRRPAVGARTSAIEAPWYQTLGVMAGLGLWF